MLLRIFIILFSKMTINILFFLEKKWQVGNQKDGVFQTIVMMIEKIKIKKGILRIYMI